MTRPRPRTAGLILLACAAIGAGLWFAFRPAPKPADATQPVRFVDVTESAGIRFRHTNGAAGKKLLPETMGSGVAVLLNCSQSTEALEARLADPGGGERVPRPVDLRVYGIGAQILRDLGVRRMRLMAAPRKMPSMAGFGLEVIGYVKGASGKG